MKNYVIKLSVFKDEKYFFISIYYYKPMICKFFFYFYNRDYGVESEIITS
jgi:hypothetical protein